MTGHEALATVPAETVEVAPGGVVVGVDGSPDNLGALHYAVTQARLLGTRLQLAHVVPDHLPVAAVMPISAAELDQLGASVLTKAEEQVREIDASLADEVGVEGWLHHGNRATALAEAAATAQLLVVGRDDRPLLERLVRGDTATGAAARSAVPVVQVPPQWRPRPAGDPRTVVVGLKSLERTEALLADAFAVADRAGAKLVVLHTWRLPSGYEAYIDTTRLLPEWRDQIHAELDPILDEWRQRYPDVEVEVRVDQAVAGQALVEAAREANLVVIARRARGIPVATHLGSTARAVLRSADCPVRVIPPTLPEDGEAAR